MESICVECKLPLMAIYTDGNAKYCKECMVKQKKKNLKSALAEELYFYMAEHNGSKVGFVSKLDKKSFSFKRGDTNLKEINTECYTCKSNMNAKSSECQKCLKALTNKLMNNVLFSKIYENKTE